MKKLLLIVLLAPALLFSQNKASTTDEEYKYLTEGYRVQQETGSDFKSGYELKKIDEFTAKNYKATYSILMHKESNQAKALSIVMSKEKDSKDKKIYLCLPFNNDELFKKFYKETESLGLTMSEVFNYTIYNITQKTFERLANRSK